MKKRVVLGAVLVIALGAVIAGKARPNNDRDYVQEAIVETENPKISSITLKTELIGKIEPEDVVYIYLKIVGKVTELNVKAGDQVTKGQQLCVIESSAVDTSKNQMDTAKLALEQANEKLNRQTILYQGGGISEETYRQYQDAVTSAELSYRSAKTQYEDALSNSRITASLDGTVETVGVTLYNSVSSDKPVCVISGQGAKVVSFSVTDRIRKHLTEGESITVNQDGKEYTGSIYEISAMADSTTGLFPVKARLNQNADGEALTTGSMVELSVVSDQANQVLTVSADAVYQDEDQAFVYTYSDGIVHKTLVETGISDETVTEIRSGLTEKDQVLSTWSSDLYDGAQVQLARNQTDQAQTDQAQSDQNRTEAGQANESKVEKSQIDAQQTTETKTDGTQEGV